MGRKAVHAAGERETSDGTKAAKGRPVKIARAVREALRDLGPAAVQGDIESWLRRKYPTLEFQSKSLSTTISNQRKKLFGGRSGSGKPTYDEMMKVKEAAATEGGLGEISTLVERIGKFAEPFGGFERLRACLKGLQELRS